MAYNEKSIKILEGLEAVRKRPGMYIGSTDKRGLHHLVWELVDNSIDEVMNGYGKFIKIILHSDGSISVSDDGRGVPTGLHESGKSTVEVIYTVLHAGGKFEEGNYKVSGGLHGVGASVVNALSKWMIVTSKRDGAEYTISFKNGGEVDTPLKKVGTTNKTGTTVRFMPDDTIFSTINFSYTTICERMQEDAFLLKGLTVQVIDEESKRDVTYHYDNGVKLYNVKDESIIKLDINLNGNIEWVDEGYIYNGEDEAYYYSIKDNKRVYEKYDEIYPVEDINNKSFTNGLKYLYGKKGNDANIIDFKTGNVILTIDINDYEGAGFKKDGSYIIASLFGVEDENNIIYNAKGEKIFDLKDNQLYEINGSKLTIYEYSKTKVKEY